jgi:tetratricopeptide (TPR) repeat protein
VRLIVLLFFITYYSPAQLLKDPTAKTWVIDGLNKAYNFQFTEAEEQYIKIKSKYPASPAYHVLMQMMLYSQFAPIKDNLKAKNQYIYHLNKSLELAENMIDKNENDTEAIFYMLSSLGSLAAWQSDNDEMMKAVNTARKAFPYMKKGMKLIDIQSDFLYTTGLYNFYIEQYPEDHPLVKPFMIFFSDGNKKLGLQQLDNCSNKAIFTYAEASYYSAYIYIKHESKYEKALQFINQLTEKYPNNLLFKSRKAECLLFLNKTDLAQPLVEELVKSNGKVYPLIGHTLQGVLDEKHNKSDKAAQIEYRKALKIPLDVRFTKDYHAMAYLGLGRIAIREKQNSQAKAFLKKAIDLSEYKSITAEAKILLKKLP